ncbi:hypothetical protein QRX50_07245 [Amycolatopsis carbonis]|uniref:Uncharacterized protein n=1 Tax=Amycolatopsis carbonis TaxID=715471 RepID=A0A9Y2MXC2_9PSEU|nr:hypothetical protein [Amycolatopsis sp. 2-15]WIX80558.1 hypothetical protein QRX50_07245 [Amycolatopsis sp. 2-15]
MVAQVHEFLGRAGFGGDHTRVGEAAQQGERVLPREPADLDRRGRELLAEVVAGLDRGYENDAVRRRRDEAVEVGGRFGVVEGEQETVADGDGAVLLPELRCLGGGQVVVDVERSHHSRGHLGAAHQRTGPVIGEIDVDLFREVRAQIDGEPAQQRRFARAARPGDEAGAGAGDERAFAVAVDKWFGRRGKVAAAAGSLRPGQQRFELFGEFGIGREQLGDRRCGAGFVAQDRLHVGGAAALFEFA